MTSSLERLRRLCDGELLRYRHACQSLSDERETVIDARTRLSTALRGQSILQKVAVGVQESVHAHISKVVTRCLAAVFDDPYEFRISFVRKRGKTEAELKFVRKRLHLDPVYGAGGGVVDVAAFALRLACLVLQKPARRRLLVLDEPFRFVSKWREYRSRVKELLETLAEEMNVQFVLVTHDDELVAGKVVQIQGK